MLAVTAVCLALAACGGAGGDTAAGSGGGDAAGQTVAQGESLYQTNCAGCHGSDLRGTRIGPPMLDEYYLPETTPDSQFVSAITNGANAEAFEFGAMPAIPGLNDEEVRAVIDYVREQQREAGLLGD